MSSLNDLLKPLRPIRAFRNLKELSQIEDETLLTYQVNTHTFAYLYITQDEEIKEYQVAYKGQAYSEKIEDIFYIGEFGEFSYIPIETDSKVDISYSNFKLDISKDKAIIKKLEKNIIYPKKLGNNKEKAFYTNSKNSLKYDEIEINSETYKTFVNYEPNFEANIYENIFCVIDDILGEIEDRNWSEIYPQLCIFFSQRVQAQQRNYGKIHKVINKLKVVYTVYFIVPIL